MEFISSTSRNSVLNKDSLSPATVIHPQPRLFLQINRSSSRVSLFPTESFSRQFILKSSSVVTPSENEELNSLYSPAAIRDLFSPARKHHENFCISIHHGMRIRIIQHNLSYFESIITQYISYIMTLHTTNSLPFRERYNQVLTSFLWFIQIDTKISVLVQAMKPRFDRIVS